MQQQRTAGRRPAANCRRTICPIDMNKRLKQQATSYKLQATSYKLQAIINNS
jgi:hypothetical protein